MNQALMAAEPALDCNCSEKLNYVPQMNVTFRFKLPGTTTMKQLAELSDILGENTKHLDVELSSFEVNRW